MDKSLIRNFSIIAHIDHGKSTLADRLLLHAGAIDERKFRNQILDDMDLERERGITIKASAVKLNYKAMDGKTYAFNLIDTPGTWILPTRWKNPCAPARGRFWSWTFPRASNRRRWPTITSLSRITSRSLPVINKIDIANIDVDHAKLQLIEILNFKEKDIQMVSAKEGTGIAGLFEKIVEFIPRPEGKDELPLQALIFDMKYDIYKGIIIYVRVVNGVIRENMAIKMMHTGKECHIEEIGVFAPEAVRVRELTSGEVGYITCNIHEPREVSVGDTLSDAANPRPSRCKGTGSSTRWFLRRVSGQFQRFFCSCARPSTNCA